MAAGGNYKRQRKSSFSFFSVLSNLFKSKKCRGGQYCGDGCEAGKNKVWPSDYDKESWGPAEPRIDELAGIFIDRQKKRNSDLQHA